MKKHLDLKNVKIVYLTTKKQLWGILKDGTKKPITHKIKNVINLNEFLRRKKLINYNDSKLFKKGANFNLFANKIKLILKNEIFIIKTLNKDNLYLNCNKKCLEPNNTPLVQKCFFNNKSPLRYPGGKTRACKVLHEILFNHFNLKKFKYIISPFFGGGSFEFFLSNKYGYKIFANDRYYYLSNFWYICKTNKNKLKYLLYKVSTIDKETFAKYKKKTKIYR